jgi:hypothetical protein
MDKLSFESLGVNQTEKRVGSLLNGAFKESGTERIGQFSMPEEECNVIFKDPHKLENRKEQ